MLDYLRIMLAMQRERDTAGLTTFDVDFNHIAKGQVITNERRADGPFQVGDRVAVVESYEDMRYQGRVARTGPNGRVFLDVDWTSGP